eukprot:766938-Hanusia_phi.AAC.2
MLNSSSVSPVRCCSFSSASDSWVQRNWLLLDNHRLRHVRRRRRVAVTSAYRHATTVGEGRRLSAGQEEREELEAEREGQGSGLSVACLRDRDRETLNETSLQGNQTHDSVKGESEEGETGETGGLVARNEQGRKVAEVDVKSAGTSEANGFCRSGQGRGSEEGDRGEGTRRGGEREGGVHDEVGRRKTRRLNMNRSSWEREALVGSWASVEQLLPPCRAPAKPG